MMGSLLHKTSASLTGNPSYSNGVNEQHEAVSDSEGGNGSFNMFQGEICLGFIGSEDQNWPRKAYNVCERSTINYISDLSVLSITAIPKKSHYKKVIFPNHYFKQHPFVVISIFIRSSDPQEN